MKCNKKQNYLCGLSAKYNKTSSIVNVEKAHILRCYTYFVLIIIRSSGKFHSANKDMIIPLIESKNNIVSPTNFILFLRPWVYGRVTRFLILNLSDLLV